MSGFYSLSLETLVDVHVELVGEINGTFRAIRGRLDARMLLHEPPIVLVHGVHVHSIVEKIVHHLGVHIVQRNTKNRVDGLESK